MGACFESLEHALHVLVMRQSSEIAFSYTARNTIRALGSLRWLWPANKGQIWLFAFFIWITCYKPNCTRCFFFQTFWAYSVNIFSVRYTSLPIVGTCCVYPLEAGKIKEKMRQAGCCGPLFYGWRGIVTILVAVAVYYMSPLHCTALSTIVTCCSYILEERSNWDYSAVF